MASILLADSDSTSLELITTVLTREGFAVQATPDGGDALARFEEATPALVLCDQSLPVLDGTHLCREVKAAEPDVRVVLLVPAELPQQERAALADATGCDAILARPFRFARLRPLLKNWSIEPDAVSSGRPAIDYGVPVDPLNLDLGTLLADVVNDAPEAAAEPPPRAASPKLPPMPIPIPIPLPPIPSAVAPLRAEAEVEVEIEVSEPPTPELDLPEHLPARGRLDELPLPRLLFELYVATFTGVVQLYRDGLERRIHIKGGVPVYVSSRLLSENLGRILIDHGRITEAQYTEAQQLAERDGLRQGEALVAIGAIREMELLQAIHAQTAIKLNNSFAWRDGDYVLGAPERTMDTEVLSEVSPLVVIWRGVREHYDAASLAAYFANISTLYITLTPLFAVHYPTLGPFLRDLDLLPLLDGAHQFAAALDAPALRAPAVAQALYALVVTDMIEPADAPGRGFEPPDDTARAASTPAPDVSGEFSEIIAHEYLRLKEAPPHAALGLEEGASVEAVESAYREALAHWSPEGLPGELPADALGHAREIVELLTRAYNALQAPVIDLEDMLAETDPSVLEASFSAEARHAEGRALMQQGDWAGARLALEAAVSQQLSEPTYRVSLAEAVWRDDGGDPAAARRHALGLVAQALRLDPAHPEGNLLAARILIDSGELAKGKQCLERVLLRAPDNVAARELLANLE